MDIALVLLLTWAPLVKIMGEGDVGVAAVSLAVVLAPLARFVALPPSSPPLLLLLALPLALERCSSTSRAEAFNVPVRLCPDR